MDSHFWYIKGFMPHLNQKWLNDHIKKTENGEKIEDNELTIHNTIANPEDMPPGIRNRFKGETPDIFFVYLKIL